MRVIKWIFGVLLGLMIVIFVGIYAYLRSTLPEYEGEITVPGIKASVEIIRDSYGMPHIYAQTDEDAYFAVGFCMAQDRLFHIDMARRLARGRLAEIIGKDLVSVDKFFRTITAGKSFEDIAADYFQFPDLPIRRVLYRVRYSRRFASSGYFSLTPYG